jgi:hypothetical protein
MAKFKGKFCKKGKLKTIEALDKGRNTRWANEDISVSNSVPITISLDHGYSSYKDVSAGPIETLTVSQEFEISSAGDNLSEEEWRTGRRIVELGKHLS